MRPSLEDEKKTKEQDYYPFHRSKDFMVRIPPLIQFPLSKKYFIKPSPHVCILTSLGMPFFLSFQIVVSVRYNSTVTCMVSDQGPLALVFQGGLSGSTQATPPIHNYKVLQVSVKDLSSLHLHVLSIVQSTLVGLTVFHVPDKPLTVLTAALSSVSHHLASASTPDSAPALS